MFCFILDLFSGFINILLPGVCGLCGAPVGKVPGFCCACLRSMPLNNSSCEICAAHVASSSSICFSCSSGTQAISHTIAMFRYRFPVDAVVLRLKSRGGIGLIPPLAELLGNLAANKLNPPDAVVPVPLHKNRLRSRGFNQSYEIAKVVCNLWDVPLDTTLCFRNKKTLPQQGLGSHARQRNMQGAFTVRKNNGYRHLLLVDDVITTGNTINSLANAVLQSGVARVEAICLARAGS